MNETRGNARTKPIRGGLIGGEKNSLKDTEKTNKRITNIKLFEENSIYNLIRQISKDEWLFNDGTWNFYLNIYSKWRVEEISRNYGLTWIKPNWNDFCSKHNIK